VLSTTGAKPPQQPQHVAGEGFLSGIRADQGQMGSYYFQLKVRQCIKLKWRAVGKMRVSTTGARQQQQPVLFWGIYKGVGG
jgi:hypothetical protein